MKNTQEGVNNKLEVGKEWIRDLQDRVEGIT